MAEENCQRTTRASLKRSHACESYPSGEIHVRNERVVLGELTNTPAAHSFEGCSKAPSRVLKKSKRRIQASLKFISDEHSVLDPKCVKFPSIYAHLRSLEVVANVRPLFNYMEIVQTNLVPSMREILVNWLVEVTEEYKLSSDTLYLAVNYIDRFLSARVVEKNKLQLLGVSSVLASARYDEISPPQAHDFSYVTDNTFTVAEILKMEEEVHKLLDYKTWTPTAKTFLRNITRVAQERSVLPTFDFEFLSCYLCELSLLDYGCLRFQPSEIAASSVFLSKFYMQPHVNPWSPALEAYTGYTALELKECALSINGLQCNERSSSRTVREKYKHHKFKGVASLSLPSDIPEHYFHGWDRHSAFFK